MTGEEFWSGRKRRNRLFGPLEKIGEIGVSMGLVVRRLNFE